MFCLDADCWIIVLVQEDVMFGAIVGRYSYILRWHEDEYLSWSSSGEGGMAEAARYKQSEGNGDLLADNQSFLPLSFFENTFVGIPF
jgi:hypothetical protein